MNNRGRRENRIWNILRKNISSVREGDNFRRPARPWALMHARLNLPLVIFYLARKVETFVERKRRGHVEKPGVRTGKSVLRQI